MLSELLFSLLGFVLLNFKSKRTNF